jgi:predicted metal-dependent hydrolase
VDYCEGYPRAYAIKGFEYFNARKYFEAHEELELAWREEKGPLKDLYRGILQVGVAYYHLLNENYTGCLKMFARSKQCLAPYPDVCLGIDLKDLKDNAQNVENVVRSLQQENLHLFDTRLLKPIQYS